jgi:hypothetical protein
MIKKITDNLAILAVIPLLMAIMIGVYMRLQHDPSCDSHCWILKSRPDGDGKCECLTERGWMPEDFVQFKKVGKDGKTSDI